MQSVDVVVVGGGLAGSALAGALARDGLEVLVLERTTTFEDRVRGEWLAPWGITEAQSLDVYEALIETGGHHLSRQIAYDELLDPAEAEAATLALSDLHPNGLGPLCLEHVRMQRTLLERAAQAGACIERGVSDVQLKAGAKPSMRFRRGADVFEIS